MMKRLSIVCVMFAALGLSACEEKKTSKDATAADSTAAVTATATATAKATADEGGW